MGKHSQTRLGPNFWTEINMREAYQLKNRPEKFVVILKVVKKFIMDKMFIIEGNCPVNLIKEAFK